MLDLSISRTPRLAASAVALGAVMLTTVSPNGSASAAELRTSPHGSVDRTLSSSTASLTPTQRCGLEDVAVPESSRGVLATGWLAYGEVVHVEPDRHSRISSGVWFAPPHGPAGWTQRPAGRGYPLPGQPRYGLIGRIGNGAWQYIGEHSMTFKNTKVGYLQKVVLRVNDDEPGNGSGAFRATTVRCTVHN